MKVESALILKNYYMITSINDFRNLLGISVGQSGYKKLNYLFIIFMIVMLGLVYIYDLIRICFIITFLKLVRRKYGVREYEVFISESIIVKNYFKDSRLIRRFCTGLSNYGSLK